MAHDRSQQDPAARSPNKVYFQVKWGSAVLIFEEVSGLDLEAQSPGDRPGNQPGFAVIKMPGMKKVGNVTLKKGVFKSDGTFWDWLNKIKMNTVKRVPVTITLLDETGTPTMAWTLANAWPTKITGTDMKAEGNEVPVETIEITHEGLTIANC